MNLYFISRNHNISLTFPSTRKKCLLLNNVFLMTGALFAVTSRAAKSFEMIIISRVLIGINAGTSRKGFQVSNNVRMNFTRPSCIQQNDMDPCLFYRNQHECAAHVFWRKCTKALKRGRLFVVCCFHSIRGCVRTGGRTQVYSLCVKPS